MYQQYINSAKTSLDYLESDELKELLNDDDKLEQRVTDSVASLELEKESMLTNNRALAEENLEQEPKLIELRGKILDLTEQGKVLCSKVQEKLTEMKSKQGTVNPETAHALLQTAGAEIEEESENIVKQFLENDFAIDVFLEKFLQTRKTMHLRKLKAEKMTELMRNPALNNSGMGYRPSSGFYPSPGNVPYPMHGSGNVPYPMGAMPMPMPGQYRPF